MNGINPSSHKPYLPETVIKKLYDNDNKEILQNINTYSGVGTLTFFSGPYQQFSGTLSNGQFSSGILQLRDGGIFFGTFANGEFSDGQLHKDGRISYYTNGQMQ